MNISLIDLPREVLLAHVISCLDLRSAARLRLVNRAFCALFDITTRTTIGEMKRLQRINRLRYHNALWTLITKYPAEKWAYWWVSKHENITLDIILSNPKLQWDWSFISMNPSITIDDIIAHRDLPWNWKYLSSNTGMSIDDVINYPELPWQWSDLRKN